MMRKFQGDGFSLLLPQAWIDRTIYSYEGPSDRGFSPWLRAVVDTDLSTSSVLEFAESRLKAILDTSPGSRLLRHIGVPLDDGPEAIIADVAWSPTEKLKLYQRILFVMDQGAGFTIIAQMNKRIRSTLGSSIDCILRSCKPTGQSVAGKPNGRETNRLVWTDKFTLALPEGWADRTVYILAEPDERRLRRNLVVQRERQAEAPQSMIDMARAEADLLRGVPEHEVPEAGEISMVDGRPAGRIIHQRRAGNVGRLGQTRVYAHRNGYLYTLTLTTEEAPPAEVVNELTSTLASFATVF